jgi:hypothetical protein
MPIYNPWLNFLRENKSSCPDERPPLHHLWKNKMANLVTLDIVYIQNLHAQKNALAAHNLQLQLENTHLKAMLHLGSLVDDCENNT